MKSWVFYHFKAKPPVITFRKVVPLDGPPGEEERPVVSSRPVTVGVPVVNLVGQSSPPTSL